MKKIIALAFLLLAISATETETTHQQAKPAATSTATTANNKATAPTAPVPVKVKHEPHKEPGYEATPGNPFGRDPQNHMTCFKSPCYDPVKPCIIATSAPATAQKQGTWKPILYVVRVNGKRAKFAGFRCA